MFEILKPLPFIHPSIHIDHNPFTRPLALHNLSIEYRLPKLLQVDIRRRFQVINRDEVGERLMNRNTVCNFLKLLNERVIIDIVKFAHEVLLVLRLYVFGGD